jgi:hypothetical protein
MNRKTQKNHAKNEVHTHRKKTKTMCYLVRLLVKCKKKMLKKFKKLFLCKGRPLVWAIP